jgi:formylglycine-generating enzyme required for sulfatase activity
MADRREPPKILGIQAGIAFRDCPECPEMVVIPAGGFDMGSTKLERESPVHHVQIESFALGKTEVTRGQFAAFVNETGYDAGSTCRVWYDSNYNWRQPGFPQTENDPVVCVNREDVQAYLQWLSRKTGQSLRFEASGGWR